jgi:hypothetical protein
VNTKPIIHVGIALILLGIVAFTYQGGGGTSGEQSVDVGLVLAAVDAKRSLPIAPFWGAVSLISGIVLVAIGIKKSS